MNKRGINFMKITSIAKLPLCFQKHQNRRVLNNVWMELNLLDKLSLFLQSGCLDKTDFRRWGGLWLGCSSASFYPEKDRKTEPWHFWNHLVVTNNSSVCKRVSWWKSGLPGWVTMVEHSSVVECIFVCSDWFRAFQNIVMLGPAYANQGSNRSW